MCGTKYNPWIITAHIGQHIRATLFDFVTRHQTVQRSQNCRMYGTIIDIQGKPNISICSNELEREKILYESIGNALHIILSSNSEWNNKRNSSMFILKLNGMQTI